MGSKPDKHIDVQKVNSSGKGYSELPQRQSSAEN